MTLLPVNFSYVDFAFSDCKFCAFFCKLLEVFENAFRFNMHVRSALSFHNLIFTLQNYGHIFFRCTTEEDVPLL